MSSLGKLISQRGKQYHAFTTVSEANDFCRSHGSSSYVYRVAPITVYGCYRDNSVDGKRSSGKVELGQKIKKLGGKI